MVRMVREILTVEKSEYRVFSSTRNVKNVKRKVGNLKILLDNQVLGERKFIWGL